MANSIPVQLPNEVDIELKGCSKNIIEAHSNTFRLAQEIFLIN